MGSIPEKTKKVNSKPQTSQSKIQEIEAFYHALAKDQEELVCRYRPDGTLDFVNESYCRYFGKSYRQLVGRNLMPLMPDGDRRQVIDQITALSLENPVTMIEHRVILPNGEIRWLRWLTRMVFDQENRFVGYQSRGRDITKRKAKNGQKLKIVTDNSQFAA